MGKRTGSCLHLLLVALMVAILSAGATGSGETSPPHLHFIHPSGLAIDSHGNVYVGDAGTGMIAEISPNGRLLGEWRAVGVQTLLGIAVDRSGNLYVADGNSSLVTKFSPTGRRLRRWGVPWKDVVTFDLPHGVALDSHGDLFVADWGNNRVVVFGPTGRPLTQWAMRGRSPGAFWHPLGIAVDRWDHVFVVDEGGWRVQEFSQLGALIASWYTKSWPQIVLSSGGLPGSDLAYGLQADVAVDRAGNVYVTNWSESSVRKFSPGGKLLAWWRGFGTTHQQFESPSGIGVDALGTVYVDNWNSTALTRLTPGSQRFNAWR